MLSKSKIRNVLTIGEIAQIDGETSQSSISEMMGNLSVSTPVLRLMRDLLGKEVRVVSRADETKANDEITERLLNTRGFNDYLASLAFLPFGEFTVHEMVFETPEGGSLSLAELVRLPNKYAKYYLEDWKSSNGWFYTPLEGDDIPIKPDDFLISIYGYSIDYPMGYGLFRYGVKQAFDDLVTVENQIRALQTKYGSVIPVFSYDPAEAETEEGMKALEDRVESIKNLGENSVLGIPLGSYNATLKDGFQFISLDSLSLDMHSWAINRLEDKLETFLMGARFSKTDSGSQAKDKVQSDQKDAMMIHITKIMCEEMNKLLKLDGELYGYEPLEYKFIMVDELSEQDKIDRRNKASESDIKVAEATIAMVDAIARLKAEGLDDETIAMTLQVSSEFVAPIQAKVADVEPTGAPKPE